MKNPTSFFKTIFTLCFFCVSQILLSQESKSKHVGENPKANSETPIRTKASTSSKTTANVQPQVDTQGKSFQVDENDAYQGRTEEFLSQIILKQLPTDFPKYESWMGVRHYNEVITDYYKKHLDILTPSVKQKLTQAH